MKSYKGVTWEDTGPKKGRKNKGILRKVRTLKKRQAETRADLRELEIGRLRSNLVWESVSPKELKKMSTETIREIANAV